MSAFYIRIPNYAALPYTAPIFKTIWYKPVVATVNLPTDGVFNAVVYAEVVSRVIPLEPRFTLYYIWSFTPNYEIIVVYYQATK